MTTQPPDDLVLYGYPSCSYCAIVRRTAKGLGVELTERNIHGDPAAARELREAMGRGTVPVLRLGAGDGPYEWMPESAVIARYLNKRFGDGSPLGFVWDPVGMARKVLIVLGLAWLGLEALRLLS